MIYTHTQIRTGVMEYQRIVLLLLSCILMFHHKSVSANESHGLERSDRQGNAGSTMDSYHTVIQTFSTSNPQNETERRCRGTSWGLTHMEPEGMYNMYKTKYTNCTYVEGNLELVFLQNHDLSFLKDIREVTGYVLIVATYADYIPLTSLIIIRGRTLYEFKKKYYSLYVALNYDVARPETVGLKELRMPRLQEILVGDVFFYDNRLLCFDDKVNWRDIMTGDGAQVVFRNVRNYTCGICHESCEVYNGERHCWGSGAQYCQKLTKLSCSPQCEGRCSGPEPYQCCHQECAAGCTGPSKDQCLACKNFYNDGSCENRCPPQMIYDPTLYRNVPNPKAKYSYEALCLDECPAYLVADGEACVQACGAGKVAQEAKCVDCDGPCPKMCKITPNDDFIHADNIHLFADCTVIQGSIRILSPSLYGDPHRNIASLSVEDLSVLENIQEVSGFVQIQANHPQFNSLSFLRNLKVIHGRRQDSGTSLQIFETSLQRLSLDALQKVRHGNIFIANNSALCYADTVNWANIRERNDQRIIVEFNRNKTACDGM